MKRNILILILMLLGTASRAQDLYVYSIIGTVKEVKGKISAELTVRQTLTPQSVVNFTTGSKLVLVDPKNSKQYTLSASGTYVVEKLIAKSKNSTKDLTKMYLSYLMKQISGKGVLTSQKAVDGGYASIEREFDDSLFIDMEIPDSVKVEE
ncbi:MAG: hypothetical protein IJT97_08025 [Bacteroidaceae bacterium]|nr:hypothetical protein [Bacteroidaceae bacterium]